MKLEFGFGNGIQTVDIPQENLMDILRANEVTPRNRKKWKSDGRWQNP